MRPEVTHAQKAAGSWPHPVDIVRRIRLSEDLGRVEYRHVVAIRIYNGNDAALSLSITDAQALRESLDLAIEQAQQGPLGDLP